MLVFIDNETMLEMLMERIRFWTDDDDTIELFKMYYVNEINRSEWTGKEFDPMIIVDNDWFNNTEYGTEEYLKSKSMFGDNYKDSNVLARKDDLILYDARR